MTMPVETIDASGKLLQMKIRGMLKKADYDRIIQIAKEAIAREGKVRALVIIEGFEGWERSGDWGDVSFMMEQGQHIEKMAIVGDEKWRDDALAFTAKGFRPTAIEFFPASRLTEAHTWLNTR
jgi:SpoIIAA-like